MFSFILFTTLIYAGSYATTLITNKKLGRNIPLFLCLFTLTVYFITLLCLSVRTSLIISIAAAIGYIVIIYIYKRKNIITVYKYNCKKCTFIYLLIVIVSLFVAIFHGADPVLWDEFAHWGQMCKEIFRLDYFYITQDTTLIYHNDYPPIIQLTNTLSCIIGNNFDLTYTYASMYFVTLLFFLVLINENEKWNPLKLLTIFVFITIFITAYDTGQPSLFLSIYQDTILSVLAAFMIYRSLKYEFSIYETLEISLLFMFIVLVKQSAILFVGISVIIILIKLIKDWKVKSLAKLFILCLCLITCYFSWKYTFSNSYCGQTTIPQFSINSLGTQSLLTNDWIFVTAKFYRSILVTNLFCFSCIPISYTISVFIITAVLILLYIKTKEKTTKETILTVLIIAFIYMIFMWISYLVLFTGEESVNLASFRRYMSTAIAVCSILAILEINNLTIKTTKIKWNKFWLVALSVELLITIICLPKIEFFNTYKKDTSIAKQCANAIENKNIGNSNCFVFDKDMDSITNLQCCYYCYNTKVQKPILLGDFKKGTWLFTGEQLMTLISSNDYLYVNNNDPSFWIQYSDIFSDNINIESNTLYKIELSNNNILLKKQ